MRADLFVKKNLERVRTRGVEGQIFWQVSDVPRMIERTGDPKGDVWYHARSALIQAVSLVTLETFMASFNAIVQQAAATDKAFYEERGVVLHNLEVVRFEPKDWVAGIPVDLAIAAAADYFFYTYCGSLSC